MLEYHHAAKHKEHRIKTNYVKNGWDVFNMKSFVLTFSPFKGDRQIF